MKRRIFLQALGLSAIATRGYTANADAAARFTHGVASGDPLSDRVILWTRAHQVGDSTMQQRKRTGGNGALGVWLGSKPP